MRILAFVAGSILVAIGIIVAIGYLLPVRHVAYREKRYDAPPAAVFAAIASPADYPRWRKGVRQVDLLPDDSARTRFREVGADGTITYVVEEITPDQRIVTRIAEKLPFGGTWTYELTPSGTGTLLRITENGEVYNPVFRFMSRFVFGHHRTIDGFLADLETHLRA